MPAPIVLSASPVASGSSVATGRLTFIGTATVLFDLAGFSILTDPNFLHAGERAYLGLGLSSRRLTEPAMSVEELPELDLVVLSHHHGDHFDRRAAEGLRKDIPIVTEPGSARKLRDQGFTRAIALENWESQEFVRGSTTLRITSMPGKHAPDPLGRLLPQVMGSLLEVVEGTSLRSRLYITGDTLVHEKLREIPRRYPDIDICVIHLGGTRIAGVLLTMDAAQGVEALRIVEPRTAVPVHYDDYTVFKSPLDEFRTALDVAALGVDVRYVDRGETFEFNLR